MARGPLSVQLYSVRQQIAEDLEGTLERLAALGFENVEPYGAFVVGSDEYAAALAATGLSAPSAHAGVLDLSDPSPAFEAAAAIGVRTIIDPAHRTEDWESVGGIARIAERINRAAEQARPRWSCWHRGSTTPSCSRSTPTGSRWAASTCSTCSAGSATACGSCT
jgi:sugar phosphate isomerase/epimerase